MHDFLRSRHIKCSRLTWLPRMQIMPKLVYVPDYIPPRQSRQRQPRLPRKSGGIPSVPSTNDMSIIDTPIQGRVESQSSESSFTNTSPSDPTTKTNHPSRHGRHSESHSPRHSINGLGTLGKSTNESIVADKNIYGIVDARSLPSERNNESTARRNLMITISRGDLNTTPLSPIVRRNVHTESCDLENRARETDHMPISGKNVMSLSPEFTNGEEKTGDQTPAATLQSSGQSTGEQIHNKVNAFLSSQIYTDTKPSAGARNGDSKDASLTNDIDCAGGMNRDENKYSQNAIPEKPAPDSRNDRSMKVDDTPPIALAKESVVFPDGMDTGKKGNFPMASACTNENPISGIGANIRTPFSPETSIEKSRSTSASNPLENTENMRSGLTDSLLPKEDASVCSMESSFPKGNNEASTCKKSTEYFGDIGIDESTAETTLEEILEESRSDFSNQNYPAEDYERNLAEALEESKKQSIADWEDDKRRSPSENCEAELQKALMESQKQLEIDTENRKRKIECSCKDPFDDSSFVVDLVSDGPDSDEEYSKQLKRAIKLSLQDKKSSLPSTGLWENISPLGIELFENAVEGFMNAHGGFQKIENGAFISEGNNRFKKKSDTCGGENQERAQYGRITIEGFKRVLDKLEGRPTSSNDEKINEHSEKCADGKNDANDGNTCNGESDFRDPEGREIKAFVDIGHGLGIQVMQVGLCLGVHSRGVELMKNRHMLAKQLESDLKNEFSAYSFEKIELEMCDFTHAFLPNKKTKYKTDNEISMSPCRFSEYDSLKRNVALRRFLMCKDLSDDEQKHLVVFGNNFNGVFGTRAGKPDVPSLDQHLAEMFANMEVGGRIVTLEDLSPLFSRNSWFRRDKFMSGSHSGKISDLMPTKFRLCPMDLTAFP
ncbi:hypothetical protein ACHAXS_009419 [Conticribra weissflogii]